MDRGKGRPGQRWISIALRSAHLAGVVMTGVGVMAAGSSPHYAAALMLATGGGLFAIDLRQHRDLWREVAGVFTLCKLVVVLGMMLLPGIARPLFWLALVASAVISHAPHAVRHRRVFGRLAGKPAAP